MSRTTIFAVLLLAVMPSAASSTTAHPFHYHWKDIGGNCLDSCNNNYYRCPCIHVNMPR